NQIIGENAGKVWGLLNACYELSLRGLLEQSKLSESDLFMSLGWLTRENKILFYKKEDELMICLDY
ncbi:MAG: winged helix-turn-helix domain-containing protein, partial [Bacteroidales bacterium]|nr:winged helix-turn-helix domain-containing protein [Bacteroidales bacterium]